MTSSWARLIVSVVTCLPTVVQIRTSTKFIGKRGSLCNIPDLFVRNKTYQNKFSESKILTSVWRLDEQFSGGSRLHDDLKLIIAVRKSCSFDQKHMVAPVPVDMGKYEPLFHKLRLYNCTNILYIYYEIFSTRMTQLPKGNGMAGSGLRLWFPLLRNGR